MIWLVLSGFLIIINDAGAYLFGITLGKTPLISVSPKKTWEGFLGGFFCTFVIGLIVFFNNRVDSKCNGEI
jgi:CDP-diglyceride synthetase